MIKRYLEFIKENQNFDDKSIGNWIESLMDDEYIRNIVNRYTNKIDTDIRVANVIDNILDINQQREIKKLVEDYLENGIVDKDPQFTISTDLEPLTESESLIGGKNIFTSFLKCLTSLGQKEKELDWKMCPDNFLFFYYFPLLNSDVVKQVFSRFKSLVNYLDLVDYQSNETNLYFGVRCDGLFEYGFHYESLRPIGQFKLSKSILRWICQLESKSSSSLKKQLVNLTYQDILTLSSIKNDMKNFTPGYHEKKMIPFINDRVISFGYYGCGKWDNGKLDEGELQNIKSNFSTFALSKKWGDKILISIKPESFWIKIHIKLK